MKKQFTIHFISGELSGRRFTVNAEGIVIGSSEEADVRCVSGGLLGEHVVLVPLKDKEEVMLQPRDSGSVAVNGNVLKDLQKVILHKDDDVKINKSLRFVLELEEAAAAPNRSFEAVSGDDDDTADATADEAPAGDSEKKASGSVTRYVSEEELEDIRGYATVQKRKKRAGYAFCIAGLLILIFAMIGYRYFTYERDLSWPGALDNTMNDDELYFKIGKNGKFLVYFPMTPKTVVKKDSTSCEVLSVIGKKRDVPFHLQLQINTLKDGFRVPKEQSFNTWRQNAQEKDGIVFTDKPTTEFYSKLECGIPGYRMMYQRQAQNVTWKGIAIYIRYEDKEIILLKEVFNRNWNRAAKMLSMVSCLSFSPDMVRNYWEVPEKLYDDSLPALSKIIARELSKNDEHASWSETYAAICSALSLAHVKNDTKVIVTLEESLHRFRRHQSVWFTRNCLYFKYCRQYNLNKEIQLLRSESANRFSGLNDYRLSKVCNDDWSL